MDKTKFAIQNQKSNSSDDELLNETEELEVRRKKHFLDYDYDDPSSIVTHESYGKINDTCSTSAAANGNNSSNYETSKNVNPTIPKLTSTSHEHQLGTTKLALKNGSNVNNNKNCSNNVDSFFSILSMLGSNNSTDITSKFLEFSKNREMCATLRQSGCIQMLIQMIHTEPNDELRQKQCLQTLHNIIHCNADDKAGRREARVIKLIEQLFDYCDALRLILKNEMNDNIDRHPIQAIGTLMKISFDEEHRFAMCQLGALQTISTLIQLDHAVHGSLSTSSNCITMRRYAGMCLTNLTFGDGNNKALLCSNKSFMKALVDQINSSSDELVQVSASVLRNLSWRADVNMKQALNEIETVKILTTVAMKCVQETSLKAILSALWNLSNHCAKNKAEICDIEGAIEFLIDMLSYNAPSKTMAVIENAGGILRNISTHMASHEKYRIILRQKNCFNILLQQLKSPSLTVVSNACGTLGNLSANSVQDQKYLRENGAIPMLRSLIYSKHKMISTGSTIALRHLLACKANVTPNDNLDSVAKMMDLKELPTLNVRKQRALEQELNLDADDYKYDDISPTTKDKSQDYDSTSSMNSKLEKSGKNLNNNELKIKDIEDGDEQNDHVVENGQDGEGDEDAPTNFSKFDDDQENQESKGEYQETNLDQITDYSIRYGDQCENDEYNVAAKANILSADDTTKCYDTEDTPQVISKAGSMSDLRKANLTKEIPKTIEEVKVKEKPSGSHTPEKTINYCVEGTPGIFSRNDSLSDLEEASRTPPINKTANASTSQASTSKPIETPSCMIKKDSVSATPKSVNKVTFGNLADETPLMFSRTSSINSLSSAEHGCDDKSSVVSDFSRLASGIMSPSELPDSPTQSMPQSPSRAQMKSSLPQRNIPAIKAPAISSMNREIIGAEAAEDSTNTFNVENTPAVFSTRTSLSNLSFDDEPKISTDAISKDFNLMKHPSEDEDTKVKRLLQNKVVAADHSDGESSDDNNVLLESCINMGMNRVVKQKEGLKISSQTNVENEGNLFLTLFINYLKHIYYEFFLFRNYHFICNL
jgi:adenomatosis polyposis coli protein